MNDINEILDIISTLGGSADIDLIAEEYCKRHRMILQPKYKKIIEATIKNNKQIVRKKAGNHEWEALKDEYDYLYVSDNRLFKTIRDAMLEIFKISVPMVKVYFEVPQNRMAWFPQPNNDNWEDTFSDDGRFWYEKPKNPNADYIADGKERYVFEHTKEGYRFTGVFKVLPQLEDGTRVYEYIDDKVRIEKPRKPLVVCRVTYMKYYDGITDDDKPVNGGSFVKENGTAAEQNNFHIYNDGYCYGFVETKYKSGHTNEPAFAKNIALENIDPKLKDADSADGIRVVFVAFSPILNANVIIGWYDNATIFRTRVIDDGHQYMMKCLSKDAHLISENDRTFKVPRGQGNPYGIGQSNYWYIQKYKVAREFEEEMIDYIDNL